MMQLQEYIFSFPSEEEGDVQIEYEEAKEEEEDGNDDKEEEREKV